MQMPRMRVRASPPPLGDSPRASPGGKAKPVGVGVGGRALRVPKFLRSLYDILHFEDPGILAWAPDGSSFQILDTARLETQVLPKYFKHGKFASFQRQLNNFGFRKWTKTQSSVCTFSHPHLVRRSPQQLAELLARRPPPAPASSPAPRRKRTFAELVGEAANPAGAKPPKRAPVSGFHASRKGDAPPKKPSARWATEPVAFLKAEDVRGGGGGGGGSGGGGTPTSSSDQPFHFSPDELHDIILPSVSAVERHDARPHEKLFELRMLNECLDLGPATAGAYGPGGGHGDLFPALPYVWDSDAFFAPPSRPHFDAHLQDRGFWRAH